MAESPTPQLEQRKVYCVMGAHSLPYAERCFASLLRSSLEPLDILVLTDAPADVVAIEAAFRPHLDDARHRLQVLGEDAIEARATEAYGAFPAIARFRTGHPCWRKVTDPALFAHPGEEVIILDPDVYFPNPFVFETTPERGFALMWQRPNCLLPEEVVRRAFKQGVAMADHTDIGVCQFRAPLPLEFLETLIATLSEHPLPRSMHIESIVWAALAAAFGGGYLDRDAWHCYANTPLRRLSRRMGKPGSQSLASLGIDAMKGFHAGGTAKTWLAEAERAGLLAARRPHDQPTQLRPFVAFSRSKFERKFMVRRAARALGLYRLIEG